MLYVKKWMFSSIDRLKVTFLILLKNNRLNNKEILILKYDFLLNFEKERILARILFKTHNNLF